MLPLLPETIETVKSCSRIEFSAENLSGSADGKPPGVKKSPVIDGVAESEYRLLLFRLESECAKFY